MLTTAQAFSIVLGSTVMTTPATDDETMQALTACAHLKNDVTRLACYDSLLRPAIVKKNQKTAKTNFGLNNKVSPLTAPVKPETPKKPAQQKTQDRQVTKQPKNLPKKQSSKEPSMAKKILNAFLQKDIEENKITSVTVELTSHKKDRNGKYRFTMKDGAVWVQSDSFRRPLKKGPFMVTISEGTFGSYIMRPEKGSWSVRVKRIK